MKLTPKLGLCAAAAALPMANAFAADASDAQALSAGIMMISILVFVMLILLAVFIWLAASITGLEGGFGRAFKAAAISVVLSIALSFTLGMLVPALAMKSGGGLMSLVIGTLSVKFAYNCGIGQAGLTYVVSVILAVVVVFLLATYVFHASTF